MRRKITEFCTLKSSNCTVARAIGLLADWFCFVLVVVAFFVIDTNKSSPQNSSMDFFITEEGWHSFWGWRQQQVFLEYTRSQSCNKIQIYDFGEWWELCGTISMRWLGQLPETHTTETYYFEVFVSWFRDTIWRKPLFNYLQNKTLIIWYWK